VNIPRKEFNSSRPKRNVQGELPTKAPSPWLGPSDEIPDVGFASFLQIMPKYFPELAYSREAIHYARFKLTAQHPADPAPQVYPIFAREQATIVGHEQIEGLLEEFGIPQQKFRDAFNDFYDLTAPELS
jgi:hypothetical protein